MKSNRTNGSRYGQDREKTGETEAQVLELFWILNVVLNTSKQTGKHTGIKSALLQVI